jgi:hypothetical protein
MLGAEWSVAIGVPVLIRRKTPLKDGRGDPRSQIFQMFASFIDKTFRSAAVGLRPQTPDKAAKGCRGLARRVKRVCAAF